MRLVQPFSTNFTEYMVHMMALKMCLRNYVLHANESEYDYILEKDEPFVRFDIFGDPN